MSCNLKSNFMRKLYRHFKALPVLTLAMIISLSALGQDTITGQVTDAGNNDPLPGVNVVIQGSSTGTVTDINGNYTLQTNRDDILVFSFIGYATMEASINGRSVVDIGMEVDVTSLQEVVVTAFGLEREKKGLTYSTQSVKLDGMAEARPNQNMVNGLQGKVAGLSIQTSGNGVTGGSKVILRGNRSVNGNSQALYVVDGVPLVGDINNLSPDDVESISVLKGANAAALYGSRANNGVIIVTTKKGREGFHVDINHTFTLDKAIILQDYQNEFGQGIGGGYEAGSTFTWGPRMDGSQVAHWSPDPNFPNSTYAFEAHPNNVEDFFETGRSLATNISISSATENNSTYFSYTHDDREGIVSGNELTRHNVNLRVENKINKKLTFGGKLNFIRSEIDNELATGENFANPIRHALRLPRNISTAEAKNFEYIDAAGALRQHYWKPGDNGGANPYWTINRNLNHTTEDRVIGYGSFKYDFTDNFSALVRTALDRTNSFRQNSFYNDSYIIAQNGRYDVISRNNHEWNTDFLLSYNKDFGDLSFNINFGGNARRERAQRLSSTSERNGLFVANVFSIANAVSLRSSESLVKRNVNSIYGFGQIGYLDALFLDLTIRNDWSSTLPSNNDSFSYPSVGLSAVVSELVTMPSAISFLKLRASYAEVGNDTDFNRLSRVANISGGFIQLSPILPNANLKPERTKSIEVGFDARFLEDRIGVDFTYYKSNSEDQLFAQDVPQGSGIAQSFLNGGDIENKGVELVLTGTVLQGSDFTWDLGFNFAKNNSEVVELAEGISQLNYGGDFLRHFRLDEGEKFGNIYSRGFVRDGQGNVVVQAIGDADPASPDRNSLAGVPQITSGLDVVIGNFNPDWIGGIRSSFRYKNFNANFVIDIRSGGEVVSFTEAVLAADGLIASTVLGRDSTLVFGQNVFAGESAVIADSEGNATSTDNNILLKAETLWTNIGGRNAPVGEAFVRSASNVRMREISIGYSLPSSLLTNLPFSSAKISFVGRNLFFISNSAKIIDPEVITGSTNTEDIVNGQTDGGRPVNFGGIQADGFESFAPPTTRSYGFNIKLGF